MTAEQTARCDPGAEIGAVARQAAQIVTHGASPAERAAFFERKAALLEQIGQPELARAAWEAAEQASASDPGEVLP